MWAFSDKVAVAGIGYSRLTRRSETPLLALALDAVDAALADAGLGRKHLDALATSPGMPRYGGAKGTVEGIDVVNPWFLGEAMGVQNQIAYTGSTNGMVTQAFIDAVIKAKPQGAKGAFVKKVSISSTMGPGLKLDIASLTATA